MYDPIGDIPIQSKEWKSWVVGANRGIVVVGGGTTDWIMVLLEWIMDEFRVIMVEQALPNHLLYNYIHTPL